MITDRTTHEAAPRPPRSTLPPGPRLRLRTMVLIQAGSLVAVAGVWLVVSVLLLDPCRWRSSPACESVAPVWLRAAQFVVAQPGVVLTAALAVLLVMSLRDFMLRSRRRTLFLGAASVLALWVLLYAFGVVFYELPVSE